MFIDDGDRRIFVGLFDRYLLDRCRYDRHFRARHGGSGPLFSTRYQADRIISRRRLLVATTYVNLNHRNDRNYAFCGHSPLVNQPAEWMNVAARLLNAVGSRDVYEAELDRTVRVREIEALCEMRSLQTKARRVAWKTGFDDQDSDRMPVSQTSSANQA